MKSTIRQVFIALVFPAIIYWSHKNMWHKRLWKNKSKVWELFIALISMREFVRCFRFKLKIKKMFLIGHFDVINSRAWPEKGRGGGLYKFHPFFLLKVYFALFKRIKFKKKKSEKAERSSHPPYLYRLCLRQEIGFKYFKTTLAALNDRSGLFCFY